MTFETMASVGEALFRPRSIALIGASDDPRKHAALPQIYLKKHGYGGDIYPVNPNRDQVQGIRAFRKVGEIDAPVDHAFIMLPTPAVPDALAECCASGVRCATVLSNGFAEKDEAGRRVQERLVEMCRKAGTRLMGPNSLGIINITDGMALSANEILSLPDLPSGGCSLISQSGSMLGALLSRGHGRNFGFSKLISLGNEADLSLAEIGEILVDDSATDTILLFLETIRDPVAMERMAKRAFAAGKPLVVFRVGSSEVGEKLAASHTGALVGNGASVDSFLRDIGALRLDTLDAFLEIAPMLKDARPPSAPRTVHVVSTTGGGGAIVIDAIGRHGITPVAPSDEAVENLAQKGIGIQQSPLIDLTLAGTNAQTYGPVLQELLASPLTGMTIAVVGSSSQFRPDRAVQPIVETMRKPQDKPLAVFLTPQADVSLKLLAEAGIAAFRSPESCADAIRAYFDWRAPRAIPDLALPAEAEELIAASAADSLDPVHAAEVFEALGINVARHVMLSPEPANWRDGDLQSLDYPVVAKIASPDILHKTEIGGVAAGIADAASLRIAAAEILARARRMRPDANIVGIQIQPMVKGLAEALLGVTRDAVTGPIITLGCGGTLAELYRDVTMRRAPVTVETAYQMISEVRGLAVINGYRNLPKGDVEALARAISALSLLALADVDEAEINPLYIHPAGEGVTAVDAVLTRRKRDAQRDH